MNAKTLFGLTVVAVGLTAAAYFTGTDDPAPTTRLKGPLFEGLEAKRNDVTQVEVTKGDETFAVTLNDGVWGLKDKGGYPVNFENVKKTIVGMAALQIIEPMTSRPERYSNLGVEDPTAPDASSTLVTLKDAGDEVLASLIVGNTKFGRGTPSVFVRLAGEERSWLCKGQVDATTPATQWLNKEVVKLDSERVQQVRIAHPDGETLTVGRATPDETTYTLEELPPARELTSPTATTPVATVLTNVTLDDVRPVGEIDFESAPGPTLVCRSFDGLVVTAQTAEVDGVTWARFEAAFEAPEPEEADAESTEGESEGADSEATEVADSGAPDPADVQKQSAELSARFDGWAFALPSWKVSYFTKRLDDLLKPLPEPEPADETPDEGEAAVGEPIEAASEQALEDVGAGDAGEPASDGGANDSAEQP